jgi:hypothetical protein
MKNTKFALAGLALIAGLVSAPLAAAELFIANDLEVSASVTETITAGNFKILATPEAVVTFDKHEKVAEDGEVFSMRVNSKGSGTPTARAIQFDAKGATEITVYALSSSKTDSRTVAIADAKTGEVVAELVVPPNASGDTKVPALKASIPTAGTYVAYGKSGAIYYYQIILK